MISICKITTNIWIGEIYFILLMDETVKCELLDAFCIVAMCGEVRIFAA